MAKSALILLDLQQGIIPMVPGLDHEKYLGLVAEVTGRARKAGVPIIHVRTAFRKGVPDINPRNKFMGPLIPMIKDSGSFLDGHPTSDFPVTVAPPPDSDDIVMTKKRTSAFTGTDLEVTLTSMGVNTLVLAGIATSGAVLSTVTQAGDLDYAVTVLEDMCKDQDDEVHRVLVEKVFLRQADVCSSSEWLKSL